MLDDIEAVCLVANLLSLPVLIYLTALAIINWMEG